MVEYELCIMYCWRIARIWILLSWNGGCWTNCASFNRCSIISISSYNQLISIASHFDYQFQYCYCCTMINIATLICLFIRYSKAILIKIRVYLAKGVYKGTNEKHYIFVYFFLSLNVYDISIAKTYETLEIIREIWQMNGSNVYIHICIFNRKYKRKDIYIYKCIDGSYLKKYVINYI